MRPRWLDRAPQNETLWQRVLLSPLLPLAWLYGAAASLDRGLYERGWRRRDELPCKVLSVGGLEVGGTAKTPLAAWLARELAARGHVVAIASRGYGRRGAASMRVVSDGRRLCCSIAEAGDEAPLLAAAAPGVPVLVSRRRVHAGRHAISRFGAQVLILDDGFQHHELARDLDLVCVDARRGFGRAHTLPRGRLRERFAALDRADGLVLVDAPLDAEDAATFSRLSAPPRLLRVDRRPGALRPLVGRGAGRLEIAGRKVGLISGIGSPASLRQAVEALGAEVVAERAFADHHRFKARDLRGLSRDALLWITTDKDAPKLRAGWARDVEIAVLGLQLEVAAAEALLRWIEEELELAEPGRRADAVREAASS